MTPDSQLELQAAQLQVKHLDALKTELMQAVVMPNLARLRAGNRTRWNDAGWFAALGAADLNAFMVDGAVSAETFPVPFDAGNWYGAETDNRTNARFRFFHRNAHLDLPAPALPSVLLFAIPHVVMKEALDTLTITVAGIPVAHLVAPSADYAMAVTVPVSGALLANAGSTVRVTFTTPVVAVPALIHAGSTDRRMLSLAVTWPTWREA